MGKITEALKKVADERIARIQKEPEIQYVVRTVEHTAIDEHIVSFHDPGSPVGEQYKIARTNIQRFKQTKNYKTFMISSSINSEGKTVTAVNLALALASDLDDQSVLLIDADMRRGRVGRYLGVEHSPGLSELLKGEAQIDAVLARSSIKNLTLLLCGKTPKNAAELLASRKMGQVIAALKGRFDYILIDTPPVMPLTDACVLGPMVDGAILVIRAARTQRGMVKHTQNRLQQSGTMILGSIMTNVEYHLPQYLYRYIQEYSKYSYKEQSA
ncbi:MAG: CpsD/CapB family tyrosine-protein kinase [Candidatus Omnitrophota bacterium]